MAVLKTLLLPGGRIGRIQFWIVYLLSWVPVVVAEEITGQRLHNYIATPDWVERNRQLAEWTPTIAALYGLAAWLYIVATINRLHDRGKSGWLVLVPATPTLACLFILSAMIVSGSISNLLYALFVAAVVAAVSTQIWLIVECGLQGRAKGSERFARGLTGACGARDLV